MDSALQAQQRVFSQDIPDETAEPDAGSGNVQKEFLNVGVNLSKVVGGDGGIHGQAALAAKALIVHSGLGDVQAGIQERCLPVPPPALGAGLQMDAGIRVHFVQGGYIVPVFFHQVPQRTVRDGSGKVHVHHSVGPPVESPGSFQAEGGKPQAEPVDFHGEFPGRRFRKRGIRFHPDGNLHATERGSTQICIGLRLQFQPVLLERGLQAVHPHGEGVPGQDDQQQRPVFQADAVDADVRKGSRGR